MNPRHATFRVRPLAAAALALPLGVNAQYAPLDAHDVNADATQAPRAGAHGARRPGPLFEARRPPGDIVDPALGIAEPPMLRGLVLTEKQKDRVFPILHGQAPALRESTKAARRAQDEVRLLILSSKYDKSQAKALVDALARAMGELAMLRVEGEHQIWLLLTVEQHQQMEVIQQPGRRS
jgi:Spy/CpxP family protein refolding chaperone